MVFALHINNSRFINTWFQLSLNQLSLGGFVAKQHEDR
jgi:hypothetical protein